MTYVEGQWKDGEKGSTYEATAAKMQNIEKGVANASLEAEEAARINVRKYNVLTTNTGAQNVKGINEAIAALPATGGTIFFAERGQYLIGTANKAEPINAEKKSGVILLGQGGVSAGGGLGYPKEGPAVNTPPTWLAYEGNGPCAINAKKTTGFGLENIEVYAYKKKFAEENGYVVDLSESQIPFMYNATVECTGETEIIQAKCMRLDNSNMGVFIRCWFKGGKDGVVGRLKGGGEDYSYNHTFIGGGFVEQSNLSVMNIHNGWTFTGVAFEPHYSKEAAETGAGGGWIGASAANMEAIGTVFNACFFGALPGKESGNAITWFGKGLTINGGEIACAETAIVIPFPSSNITLTPHINLVKTGLAFENGAKNSSGIYYRPSFGETFAKGAITPAFFAAEAKGTIKGSIFQTAAGKPWVAVSTTLGSLANTEARVKELTELVKSLGFSE